MAIMSNVDKVQQERLELDMVELQTLEISKEGRLVAITFQL